MQLSDNPQGPQNATLRTSERDPGTWHDWWPDTVATDPLSMPLIQTLEEKSR